jgi:hypothetical protein
MRPNTESGSYSRQAASTGVLHSVAGRIESTLILK